MLSNRIYQYQFIPPWVKRNIFIFHCTTIQPYQIPFFTENRRKLIHNTTIYSAIIMLSFLSNQYQFFFVQTSIENFIQSKSKSTFQGSRRRKAGTQRYIPRKNSIKTFNLSSPLLHFTAYAKNVMCPCLNWFIFLLQPKFGIGFQIHRVCTYLFRPIRLNLSQNSFINSPRQYITSIIICMCQIFL